MQVTHSGEISTTGDGAMGILAQSLGGAAGGGGDSYGIIGDGGGGTSGGNGGTVTVDHSGLILTAGDTAHGILVQSIGGSGGNAGNSGGIVTFGDSGDAGGNGGSASIIARNGSSTQTTGEGSHGLFAQLVGGGGGGGDSGSSGGAVTLGASGDAGGAGGAVQITTGGAVSTEGLDSRGVFAQSVGGGGSGSSSGGVVSLGGTGGGGGLNVTGAVSFMPNNNASVAIGLGVGDFGGGGGHAGAVTGTVTGDYITAGREADGVVAQSLGGGGGNGGLNVSGAVALGAGTSGTATVGIGGFGGADGDSGDVILTLVGDTQTDGANSDSVIAQSLAGGGGTLFATGGAGIDNGLEISDTIPLDYSVRADAAGVHLGFVSDFGQDFLNDNGQSLGRSIDSALIAGGSGGIGRLAALLGNQRAGDEDAYSAIFTELDPSPHLEPLHLQFATANSFSNELFGCTNLVVQSGEQCVWSRI